MNELGYADALSAGIEPVPYRTVSINAPGPGEFPGTLDALVWAKRQPALLALVTLDTGLKVVVVGYHRNRDGVPYAGLRNFTPGQKIKVNVEVGPRNGLRSRLSAINVSQCSGPAYARSPASRPWAGARQA
ncbi:hypothetical protein DEV91_10650 [Phyllobacterium brassicacearum]|nr:hypothetical protein DEV91_10650 [Phyllobacterium brassicacearum]